MPQEPSIGIYYYTLGAYCDHIYTEMVGNDVYRRSQKQLKRREDELKSIYSRLTPKKEKKTTSSFLINRLLKEIAVEKMELLKVEKDAAFYLRLCLENYLASLSIWDQKLEQIVLRLCALWFSNSSDDEINTHLKQSFKLIPSERFLIVAYQLCARLVSTSDNEVHFREALLHIVEKIVCDYPYHSLSHLHALKNGGLKEKTSIEARKILEYLCNKDGMLGIISKLDKLIKGCLHLKEGYIELANDPIPDEKFKKDKSQSNSCKIDSTSLLFKIEKEGVPIITIKQPLIRARNYADYVGVQEFHRSYRVPGGIHAPKVISCIGTDGIY